MSNKTCPRCDGPLAAFEHDRGTLSRVSTSLGIEVMVCGSCGIEEAFMDPQGQKGFDGWARRPLTLKLVQS